VRIFRITEHEVSAHDATALPDRVRNYSKRHGNRGSGGTAPHTEVKRQLNAPVSIGEESRRICECPRIHTTSEGNSKQLYAEPISQT
jgi:hypothetical protein